MESCRVTLRYLKSDPRPNSYANLVSPFPYVCVLKEHRLLCIFHHYYLFCCLGCGKRARKCLICQAEPPSLLCLPQTPALLCSPKASGAGDTLAAPWGHLGPPSPAPARSGCTVWQPESWGWCQRGARRPPAPSPAMTIPCFVCPGSEMRGEWKVRQLPTGTGRDAARWLSHPVHTSCSQCRGCSPASLAPWAGSAPAQGVFVSVSTPASATIARDGFKASSWGPGRSAWARAQDRHSKPRTCKARVHPRHTKSKHPASTALGGGPALRSNLPSASLLPQHW